MGNGRWTTGMLQDGRRATASWEAGSWEIHGTGCSSSCAESHGTRICKNVKHLSSNKYSFPGFWKDEKQSYTRVIACALHINQPVRMKNIFPARSTFPNGSTRMFIIFTAWQQRSLISAGDPAAPERIESVYGCLSIRHLFQNRHNRSRRR
jgi:hypothetical protein